MPDVIDYLSFHLTGTAKTKIRAARTMPEILEFIGKLKSDQNRPLLITDTIPFQNITGAMLTTVTVFQNIVSCSFKTPNKSRLR